MSIVAKDQIHGWKEIAAYLGRDERTAKRWEKQRGLPVRRIPGAGRANVYILVSDLEAWLADGSSPLHTPDSPSDDQGSGEFEAFDLNPVHDQTQWQPAERLESPALPANPPAQVPVPRSLVRLSTAFLITVGAFTTAGYAIHAIHAPHQAPATYPPTYTSRVLYKSPAAGADQLYLQGVYFLDERTPASLEAARRIFSDVIVRDPKYAAAYAGLANTYLMLREFSSMPSDEAYTKARAAAEHAIALDPNLPDAHASLGFVQFFSDWTPESATEQFKTALRLDPNCVLAHHWYGSMLTHQGLYSQAIEELDAAQRLQPTSSAILASKALAIGRSGQRDEASRMLQSLLKVDPNAPAPHRIMGYLSLMAPRNPGAYLDEMQKFAEIRKDVDQQRSFAAGRTGLQRGGERGMWTAILAYQRSTRPSQDQPNYTIAQAETQLGLDDQAIRDLETLADRHDSLVMNIVDDALFDPLRQNPRFQKLVDRIGLNPRNSSN